MPHLNLLMRDIEGGAKSHTTDVLEEESSRATCLHRLGDRVHGCGRRSATKYKSIPWKFQTSRFFSLPNVRYVMLSRTYGEVMDRNRTCTFVLLLSDLGYATKYNEYPDRRLPRLCKVLHGLEAFHRDQSPRRGIRVAALPPCMKKAHLWLGASGVSGPWGVSNKLSDSVHRVAGAILFPPH